MALPPRRVDMIVGTPEWAQETLWYAKRIWQSKENTEDRWRGVLNEIKEGRAWEPLGKRTLNELMRAEFGVSERQSFQQLGKREHGISGGKAGPGRGNKTGDDVTRFQRGNQRVYLLARLARDGHIALLQQVDAGEKSAHAAAKEVGYRKTPTTLDRLETLWAKATPAERTAFMARRGTAA